MTFTTWNPNDLSNEILSNNNLTSTFPGSDGNYNGVRGTTAISDGQKAYFEVDTSGFYAGSAFALGLATANWGWGNTGDGQGGGVGYGDISEHWDGIVDVGGNWIANPHRTTATMQEGGHLDIAVDRALNKAWFKSSLDNQWDESPTDDPATGQGGYDISSLAGSALYPLMSDGTGSGPVATINGGSAPFHDAVPAGFTALDNLDGSGSTPTPAPTPAPPSDSGGGASAGSGSGDSGSSGAGSGSDTVTVWQPSNLQTGSQTISGTETDPSQTVWVDWHTYGTPDPNGSDWVQATTDGSGNFSATVDVDHAGTNSTMFYRIGNGPAFAAWSATPSMSFMAG